MFTRKNRKVCMVEKGKENFDFNVQKEIGIYKYVSGFGMRKKEYSQVCEHLQFNSYRDWENYIETKYSSRKKSELKEFKKYLNQLYRNKKTSHNASIMAATAVFTCALTVAIDKFIDGSWKPEGADYLGLIALIILGALALAGFTIVMKNVIDTFWNSNVESSFYEDYIAVIDKIIKNK